MTQFTITVDNPGILPHLKSVLKAIEGVTVTPVRPRRKCGLDKAYDDVRAGRINHYESVDEMFEKVLGK